VATRGRGQLATRGGEHCPATSPFLIGGAWLTDPRFTFP
jgi:hypothetical protein